MVHLVVHLVKEVRLCGPVYLRWMYLVERYMKILKGFVKNHYSPKASMIERYITEESIEFCSEYMSKANPIGLPANSWHHRRSTIKCLCGMNIVSKSQLEVLQAHLYILNNIDEVIPYIEAHKAIVKANNPRQVEKWVLMEHNRTFMPWFKDKVLKDSTASKTLTWLATGLKFDVISCKAYKVNNCIFYTKSMDGKSTIQNSSVTIEVESMQFSTSKNTNPVLGLMAYYGFIEEIWEVDYTKFC